MIILGIALVIVGALVPQLSVLLTIGVIVLVVGLVLLAFGGMGHPVAGRRYWY